MESNIIKKYLLGQQKHKVNSFRKIFYPQCNNIKPNKINLIKYLLDKIIMTQLQKNQVNLLSVCFCILLRFQFDN